MPASLVEIMRIDGAIGRVQYEQAAEEEKLGEEKDPHPELGALVVLGTRMREGCSRFAHRFVSGLNA